MNIKIISVSLICICVFLGGCGNNQITEPSTKVVNTKNNTKPNDSSNNGSNSNNIGDIQNNTTNTTSTTNISYDIAKETYTNKGIKIIYPQIMNMADTTKQNLLNEIIKSKIVDYVLNYYILEDIDNLSLNLDYDVKYKSTNILSIQYSGEEYLKTAPHPNRWVYTTNLDIKDNLVLSLKDVVNIDEKLLSLFRNSGKFTDFVDDGGIQDANNYLSTEISDNDLMQGFQDSNTTFYFTNDSLVFVVYVQHAMGDYWEREIKYKDITSANTTKNEVWEDLSANHTN